MENFANICAGGFIFCGVLLVGLVICEFLRAGWRAVKGS